MAEQYTKKMFLEHQGRSLDGVVVDFDKIIILPQVRSVKEVEINALKLRDSIASLGMISLPYLAIFDRAHYVDYLNLTNSVHKQQLDIKQYQHMRYGSLYFVLLAGHCRMEACKEILSGKAVVDSQTPDGQALVSMLKRNKIAVKLAINLPASEAKTIQLDENLHTAVSPDSEALAISEMFFYMKHLNPDLTLNEFARTMRQKNGYGLSRIKAALRFALTPDIVRSAVASNVIFYGHAVLIGKYIEDLNPLEWQITDLLGQTINRRWTVEQLEKEIIQIIRLKKSGQKEMGTEDLFGLSAEQFAKNGNSDAAKKASRLLIMSSISHFASISFLFEKKILNLQNSPLLDQRMLAESRKMISEIDKEITVLEEACNQLEKMAVHSGKLLSLQKRLNRLKERNTLPRLEAVLSELENELTKT